MDVQIFYLTSHAPPNAPAAPVVDSAIVDMPIPEVLAPSLQMQAAATMARTDGVTINLGLHTFRDPSGTGFVRRDALRWVPPSAIIGVQILVPSREDWSAPVDMAVATVPAADIPEIANRVRRLFVDGINTRR